MSLIYENIVSVNNRITAIAIQCGRNPQDIVLVAITKKQPLEKISEAISLGIEHIGENRVQEAISKLPLLQRQPPFFHFVGHLQTNKVKALLRLKPCLIHSVDSLHLAECISDAALNENYIQDILLQINTTQETQKSGFSPSEIVNSLHKISELKGIAVKGLMTMGRFTDNPEDNRPYFRALKHLAAKLDSAEISNIEMNLLSMGMTDDFEIAIAEGATHLRIGTAIFGPRTEGVL